MAAFPSVWIGTAGSAARVAASPLPLAAGSHQRSMDLYSIAFAKFTGHGWRIETADPTGGSSREVRGLPEGNALAPRWAPDGQRIAFWLQRGRRSDIYVIDTATNDLSRLTADGMSAHPSWSPDGSKIVFDRWRVGGNTEIFTMKADGSDVVRLTRSTGLNLDPAWSPAGSKIAFVSDRNRGNPDIFVMNADGSRQRSLNTALGFDGEPDWSPNGRRIAFASERAGQGIFLMRSDGSGLRKLVDGTSYEPSWSPDGRRIVFHDESATAQGISIVTVRSGRERRIVRAPSLSICCPDWAPLLPMQGGGVGALDPSFGIGGKVTTQFAGRGGALADAVTVQPDGKIVVAGRAGIPRKSDFALTRYNTDGTLDRTFGIRGKVRTDLGGRGDRVAALALQTDGKIVATGTNIHHANFATARYNANGTLDETFGAGGKVSTNFGRFDVANALAIQPDGKIVVAGYAAVDNTDVGFALVRYDPNGTLDSSFGASGRVFTVFPDGGSEVEAVSILPDGKIIAAGFSSTPSDFGGAFALARYTADGTLDPSFGVGGIVTTTFAGQDTFGYALAVQPDGKVVVSGRAGILFDPDFALARYNVDGTLDDSFGEGGKVTTDFAGQRDIAFATVLQADGRIVAAGRSGTGATTDFALARYNPDGTLDTSFGTGGKVTTDFAGQLDVAYACVLQTDERIVAVGRTGARPDTTFAASRYQSGI